MTNKILSEQLTLRDLKTVVHIDLYSHSLIKNSDTEFFPSAAAKLLNSIVLYCIKSGIFEFDKLMEIVNSDRLFINELMMKYPETQEACKVLNDEKPAINILQVIRFNLSQKQKAF